MLNKPNRNDVDDGVQDIQNDVNRLADSLEDVLNSGSDAKDEAEAARRKAQALLKETRARMHGRTRVKQAACDAMGCADTFVREKPRCSVGTAAAVGILSGRCLACVANDARCRMATYFIGLHYFRRPRSRHSAKRLLYRLSKLPCDLFCHGSGSNIGKRQ